MIYKVPFVSIAKQYKKHSKALNKVFSECASSGQYILGDKVEEFEENLAKILVSKSFENCDEALEKAKKHAGKMRVEGVVNLDDALKVLTDLGGNGDSLELPKNS